MAMRPYLAADESIIFLASVFHDTAERETGRKFKSDKPYSLSKKNDKDLHISP